MTVGEEEMASDLRKKLSGAVEEVEGGEEGPSSCTRAGGFRILLKVI